MKKIKTIAAVILAATVLAGPLTLSAADANKPKAKPYPLKVCLVSGEKLGGMGDPYVFVHEGQEIKLCCKGCLKDFKKEPAKYLKKIEEAEKNKK
jgi:hypothetical protein